MKLGLIGFPLSHTFSPTYFSEKFEKNHHSDHSYDTFPIAKIEEVVSLAKQLDGFNVTIPYKEQIIPFLDDISQEAMDVGAVNTVKKEDGQLIGYNTDVYGFEVSLRNFIPENFDSGALILGSGGACKAVKYVLGKMNIDHLVVSRSKTNTSYQDLKKEGIKDYKLIINTTPLGMFPKINSCPDINFSELSSKHYLYDLIYNPEKTLFLKYGEAKKSKTLNGKEMLILQAEKSWEIWK